MSPGAPRSREIRRDGHAQRRVAGRIRIAEVAALLLAVIAINSWNRVAISQRLVAGAYVSPYGMVAA